MMKQKLEINSLIDSYKDFLIYEKGLSENTVSAYISDINKVSGQEEYFDIENFLPDTYLMSSNNKNYSGSTKKRIQSSINQFLKYLIDENYIANIDNAISVIALDRAKYGAIINRLDHAMANMANVVTNLSAAKGRIMDADYAAESANLARTQVLQQASMAMLSQANASKQNILALFQ